MFFQLILLLMWLSTRIAGKMADPLRTELITFKLSMLIKAKLHGTNEM